MVKDKIGSSGGREEVEKLRKQGARVFDGNTDYGWGYINKSIPKEPSPKVDYGKAHFDSEGNFSLGIKPQDPNIAPLRILGLEPNATKEQVKVRYHRLMLENHPDRYQHLDNEAAVGAAEERFMIIKNAYDAIIQESLPEANVDQE